jgi:hypothetical protein
MTRRKRAVILAGALALLTFVPRAASAGVCEAMAARIIRFTGATIDEQNSDSISLLYGDPVQIVIHFYCDPDKDGVVSSLIGGAYPPSDDFWTIAGVAVAIAMDSSSGYVETGGRDCFSRVRNAKEDADGGRYVEPFARVRYDFSCSVTNTSVFLLRITKPDADKAK